MTTLPQRVHTSPSDNLDGTRTLPACLVRPLAVILWNQGFPLVEIADCLGHSADETWAALEEQFAWDLPPSCRRAAKSTDTPSTPRNPHEDRVAANGPGMSSCLDRTCEAAHHGGEQFPAARSEKQKAENRKPRPGCGFSAFSFRFSSADRRRCRVDAGGEERRFAAGGCPLY
jgi:hypothetical protein